MAKDKKFDATALKRIADAERTANVDMSVDLTKFKFNGFKEIKDTEGKVLFTMNIFDTDMGRRSVSDGALANIIVIADEDDLENYLETAIEGAENLYKVPEGKSMNSLIQAEGDCPVFKIVGATPTMFNGSESIPLTKKYSNFAAVQRAWRAATGTTSFLDEETFIGLFKLTERPIWLVGKKAKENKDYSESNPKMWNKTGIAIKA